jgi:very-short-patch-repair endonuclease
MATRLDLLKRPQRNGRAEPAVAWRQVAGRVVRPREGGAVNQAEAEAVVNVLRWFLMNLGYDGSIGVVTPFRAHANRIRELVHRDGSLASRLCGLDFVADVAHGFQGDERDVMLFSPAVSDQTPPGALWFLRSHPNLFNVAVTRARAALIVVGDHGAALRSEVEYLSRFARYVAAMDDWSPGSDPPVEHLGPTYPPVRHPDRVSEWERYLYGALHEAGLRPIPQYDFAGMILDFALLEGDRRLAIEVDGEMYHRAWDGDYCRRDQVRNWRLLEAGWDVQRVWIYEIRDHLTDVVNRITSWHEIAARGRDSPDGWSRRAEPDEFLAHA